MSTLEKLQTKTHDTADIAAIRADFPTLTRQVHGKTLVYLDNAATTQKPAAVIDAVAEYYRQYNSNVHRGVHSLSEEATAIYEGARKKIQHWINAASTNEIIFVKSTTEGINLVAQSYGRSRLGRGDEVLITEIEHHSNIVPWQLICEQQGATLRYIPMSDCGELQLDELDKLLTSRTAIVAIGHVSNAFGTIHPIQEIIKKAHALGAVVLIDGAQGVAHERVDVQALDCDFYVFSGHKLFAPTGTGVLYGKEAILADMPPWQGGGDMIRSVHMESAEWNTLPWKFEAGTPNIAGFVGLGAAIDYLGSIDFSMCCQQEQHLLHYATEQLEAIEDLRIIGTAEHKVAIISFVLDNIHPHDIGTILDMEGIAIRAGHHCAMPAMEKLHLAATARASFAFYNSLEEVDMLVAAIEKCKEMFSR